MAAAGTGLPGSRGDVASSPANMSGMGAAEAASADALFRVQAGFRNLTQALEPAAQQAAAAIAEQDVQAGQFRERMAITGADQAYNEAMRTGTLAKLGNARDNDLDALRLEHAFDPDAFQKAASEYRTAALQGPVPGGLAIDWAADFDRRSTSILSTIRTARANVDLEESKGALNARRERLVSDMLDGAGGRSLTEVFNDPSIVSALEQLGGVHDELAANPAFGVSREEADAARASDIARVKAGVVQSAILNTYRTLGADAALGELQELVAGSAAYATPSGSRDGMVVEGNLDLTSRPQVQNDDGTVSTVRTISIEQDGQHILIPTVTEDGRVVADDEAVAIYEQSGKHLGVFATEDAATAYAEALHEDQAAGRTGGLGLSRTERQLAFNTARDAVQQEIGLSNQRRNQAEAAQAQAEREVGRLIDEDVARVSATGQGSGLTEAEVRSVGGDAAVMRWYKQRAEATEFHNLVGTLPLDDPEAAAAQIAAATARRTTLSNMPLIQDAGDLATITNAMIQVESSGVNGQISADPDGVGPAGGGAYGIMQVMPDTARRIAGKLGLPYDANRLRTDAAYNKQIGTEYLSELVDRYNGDTFLAVTAYHAGEGNVDGWLKSVGDPRSGRITREAWLDGVEQRGNPRSAAYPRKVLAALGAGQQAAAWESYHGNRALRATDPAVSVQADFAVRGARERWQAAPNSVPAAESYVQANIDAQDRVRIQQGQRRTLPVATLAIYAGDLTAFEQAGDVTGFQTYLQRVSRQFGKHGDRVAQDILEVRGDTRFAAQVGARAMRQAQAGVRPSRTEVEQANTAGRAEQANRAGAGTTTRSVQTMSNADLLAAAGLN